MDSDDDWCYVDSESWCVRLPGVSHTQQPEPESEPRHEVTVKAVTPAAIEDMDSTALMSETSPSESPRRYSREQLLEMLSPSHRRYAVTGVAPAPTPSPRKRPPIRDAFMTPSCRVHSGSTFPQRLRAAMPSRHGQVDTVKYTDTQPFTRDQGVQTETPVLEASSIQAGRMDRLASALTRSLTLSMEVKTKAQQIECQDVREMRSHLLMNERDQKIHQLKTKLSTTERGLQISRQRSEIAEQYQQHLKTELAQLRSETATLTERIEVLGGGLEISKMTMEQLEHLEDKLAAAMAKVRSVLRSKYRAATATKQHTDAATTTSEEEQCVVCLEKLACVRIEPCGHEVLCSQCAVRVSACPVDRTPILDRVLTHGLNLYKNQ